MSLHNTILKKVNQNKTNRIGMEINEILNSNECGVLEIMDIITCLILSTLKEIKEQAGVDEYMKYSSGFRILLEERLMRIDKAEMVDKENAKN